MEPNFDLHILKNSGKNGWHKIKRKNMRRSIALLLSVILAAGTCMSAVAAEQPVQEETVESVTTEIEQAATEETASESEAADTGIEEAAGDQVADEATAGEVEEADTEEIIEDSDIEEVQVAGEENDHVSEEKMAADDVISGESGEPEEVLSESGEPEAGETSDWLKYFDYQIDGGKVILTGGMHGVDYYWRAPYDGVSELDSFTVPATARVDGVTYNTVEVASGIEWLCNHLSFESGVVFAEDSSNFFSRTNTLHSIDLSNTNTSNVTSINVFK